MSLLSKMLQNIKRFTGREPIPVIHDDDLEKVLLELGYLDEISSGKVSCGICGSQITIDNLAGWVYRSPECVFFCDQTDCLLKFQIATYGDHEDNG
jgi:hypothetical protein